MYICVYIDMCMCIYAYVYIHKYTYSGIYQIRPAEENSSCKMISIAL